MPPPHENSLQEDCERPAFRKALGRVLSIEGGYSDDPADSGGRTRFGITEAVARRYGYGGAMDALPLQTAEDIYFERYWKRMRLHHVAPLAPALSERLFDAAVNCGTARAAFWLQRGLNALNRRGTDWADIAVDGIVGPRTIGAFQQLIGRRGPEGAEILSEMVRCLQGTHYVTLAERRQKDERFVFGWFRQRIVEDAPVQDHAPMQDAPAQDNFSAAGEQDAAGA